MFNAIERAITGWVNDIVDKRLAEKSIVTKDELKALVEAIMGESLQNLSPTSKSFVAAEERAIAKGWDYTSVQTANCVSEPKTWTTVANWETVNADRTGMLQKDGTIRATAPGIYLMAQYCNWPEGVGDYRLQRFNRNPYAEKPDDFGNDERLPTAGRTFMTNVYPFMPSETLDVGMQVKHDNTESLKLNLAQFKLLRIA